MVNRTGFTHRRPKLELPCDPPSAPGVRPGKTGRGQRAARPLRPHAAGWEGADPGGAQALGWGAPGDSRELTAGCGTSGDILGDLIRLFESIRRETQSSCFHWFTPGQGQGEAR